MLELIGIKHVFDKGSANEKTAIDGVNFTLSDDDFVTVIGGNGAGKSTLLNIIAGTIIPNEGIVKIDGKDITSLPEYKRAKYLGRVFQDPLKGTAPDMNIAENLSLAARRGERHTLRWNLPRSDNQKYQELLAGLNLGLEERLENKVGLLSGGQRQALTLLMATMKQPRLLLLDEHTAALDPGTAKKVMEITQKVVEENHTPTFMVTHNMKDAIKYGNRLIMMKDGKIVFEARGEEKAALKVSDLIEKFSDGDVTGAF